jgi:hypothetical protein
VVRLLQAGLPMNADFPFIDVAGRRAITIEANSLESVAARLIPFGKRFVLVIAADTSDRAGPGLVDAAAELIRVGASYVCCWGPDCGRLEECFDEAAIEVNGAPTRENVLMTSSHEHESWEEAIWFGLTSAFPGRADGTPPPPVVIASIANGEWAERARGSLSRTQSTGETRI